MKSHSCWKCFSELIKEELRGGNNNNNKWDKEENEGTSEEVGD